MEYAVSVIMPIYNDASYLLEAIQSVQNQTLKDLEIICVNDGSTDSSLKILTDLALNDKRIKIINHERNLGTCQSRKEGVLASKGRVVMFLDGDDILDINACQISYNTLVNEKVDILHFGTNINNCKNINAERILSNENALKPYLGHLKDCDLINLCFENHLFGPNLLNKAYEGAICRKAFSCVEKGYFIKGEDWYVFLVILYFSHSYLGIKEKLYNYNFGRGGTGGDILNIAEYLPLLNEKLTYQAIERFLENKNPQKYHMILKKLYDHFLGECIYKWLYNLENYNKDIGFNELIKCWGYENVFLFLASHFWDNTFEVGKNLLNNQFFKFSPRVQKRKLTIAAYYRNIANGGAQRVTALLCNRWAKIKDQYGNLLYDVVLITDESPIDNEYELV